MCGTSICEYTVIHEQGQDVWYKHLLMYYVIREQGQDVWYKYLLMCHWPTFFCKPPWLYQHTRELISARKASHRGGVWGAENVIAYNYGHYLEIVFCQEQVPATLLA